MNRHKRPLSATLGLALAVTVALIAALGARAAGRPATATAAAPGTPKPTIVLVHGAWANTASWSGVIQRLQAEGYTVDAPPNPLLSLKGDAATIADFLKTIKGPIVLVGHSYGGAVITNAARGIKNVRALVYVDAFAPARGENVFALTAKFPGSALTAAPPAAVFTAAPLPGAPKSDPLLYVKPSVFIKSFANDLPTRERSVLAAVQAPLAMAAATAPSGAPAWASLPSWYVVGTVDRIIPPAAQMFMAHRIHAHISQVAGGHLSMVSHPAAVANVITRAAHAVG